MMGFGCACARFGFSLRAIAAAEHVTSHQPGAF